MGIIINCTLIAGATAALLLGAGYFNREKTSGITRWVILLLGIFVCLWCGGYGAMGFCENFDHANSLKMIGLIGRTVDYLIDNKKTRCYIYGSR